MLIQKFPHWVFEQLLFGFEIFDEGDVGEYNCAPLNDELGEFVVVGQLPLQQFMYQIGHLHIYQQFVKHLIILVDYQIDHLHGSSLYFSGTGVHQLANSSEGAVSNRIDKIFKPLDNVGNCSQAALQYALIMRVEQSQTECQQLLFLVALHA